MRKFIKKNSRRVIGIIMLLSFQFSTAAIAQSTIQEFTDTTYEEAAKAKWEKLHKTKKRAFLKKSQDLIMKSGLEGFILDQKSYSSHTNEDRFIYSAEVFFYYKFLHALSFS